MSNAAGLLRSLIVYGLCLPLAIFLGYLLANPLDLNTIVVTGIILFLLLVPLLLRWHHTWLIAAWNMSAVIFFLPGRPPVWFGLAAISLIIGIMHYTINRNAKFLHVPSVMWPLLFLTGVVLVTMFLTGGIGLRILGSSSYGGRNYFGVFAAIVGYFALISRRIPPKRAGLYITLFFLGGATMAIGDLPLVLPREFSFIYLIFPVLKSGSEALQDTDVAGESAIAMRVTGLGFLSAVLLLMTFALQFYLERLHQTRMLPVLLIVMLLGGTLMAAFANRMPFMVQRSMAFLPVNIDPLARLSAAGTSEWRLQMWRELLPQVPKYLILGKGYSFSADEMFMTQFKRGMEGTILTGDYHNGPLSVIIPFGIFGAIGFLWFLWAGYRVLYQNFKFGDPAYIRLNTYLLAFYIVRAVFFLAVFGGLVADLALFVSIIGLSISLNGGVAKPVVALEPKVAYSRFKLHPSAQRPVSV
ncbi:MAG: O-antigen ligase family protein [Verrucomicrobia bacterium]|nr:O-antigen ligase family protein [Verrucomicrobiota bacterium]